MGKTPNPKGTPLRPKDHIRQVRPKNGHRNGRSFDTQRKRKRIRNEKRSGGYIRTERKIPTGPHI